MATRYATLWPAQSPLARCTKCGAQRQFHGRPNFSCTDFTVETAEDVEPGDLNHRDLVIHTVGAHSAWDRLSGQSKITDEEWNEIDRLDERVRACRAEIGARIEAVFGVSIDDIKIALEG